MIFIILVTNMTQQSYGSQRNVLKKSRNKYWCWQKAQILRAKTTFKVWYFYFLQILTVIVEKRNILTPFNFFFKFPHCLTLFPIFSVHVNWIVFYLTAHLFKFDYQQLLRKICYVVTKAGHEVIIPYEFWKYNRWNRRGVAINRRHSEK